MTAATDELLAEVRRALHPINHETARNVRRDARITQARMAEALGVDRSTLARWESGRMSPRPAQSRRWSELIAALQRELRSA